MMQILKDVKAAVKELTGEDVSNITEALEQLGLKNEGTLKEKMYAAARELNISIFVEVRDFVWAHTAHNKLSPAVSIYISLDDSQFFFPPSPGWCVTTSLPKMHVILTKNGFDEHAVFRPNGARDDRSWIIFVKTRGHE